jgi:hypothetical protein
MCRQRKVTPQIFLQNKANGRRRIPWPVIIQARTIGDFFAEQSHRSTQFGAKLPSG